MRTVFIIFRVFLSSIIVSLSSLSVVILSFFCAIVSPQNNLKLMAGRISSSSVYECGLRFNVRYSADVSTWDIIGGASTTVIILIDLFICGSHFFFSLITIVAINRRLFGLHFGECTLYMYTIVSLLIYKHFIVFLHDLHFRTFVNVVWFINNFVFPFDITLSTYN